VQQGGHGLLCFICNVLQGNGGNSHCVGDVRDVCAFALLSCVRL
jgi:hypothetical protein